MPKAIQESILNKQARFKGKTQEQSKVETDFSELNPFLLQVLNGEFENSF